MDLILSRWIADNHPSLKRYTDGAYFDVYWVVSCLHYNNFLYTNDKNSFDYVVCGIDKKGLIWVGPSLSNTIDPSDPECFEKINNHIRCCNLK